MIDDLTLEQRVHQLIYDADPTIPAVAVVALVESTIRAKIADEIRAMKVPAEGVVLAWNVALDAAADRVARGDVT